MILGDGAILCGTGGTLRHIWQVALSTCALGRPGAPWGAWRSAASSSLRWLLSCRIIPALEERAGRARLRERRMQNNHLLFMLFIYHALLYCALIMNMDGIW